MEYFKAEKIYLKNSVYDEKWLQDRIEEDTTILGLGDLITVQRERKQSTGGRIDFLFHDPEKAIMYETEIMLGSTDESHIIRTIEYWDIEKRRFPSKDHKAVIVAEDITNRFFNVISLMNRSIPIIAIQLNALKVDDKIILNFTKVLDVYEQPEDEEDLVAETVDRSYWEHRSSSESITIVDEMIKLVSETYQNPKVTYNKFHIALGTKKQNFLWFHPRKKEGYCYIQIRIGKENAEKTKILFDEVEISFNQRKENLFAFSMYLKELNENKDKTRELLAIALEQFAT
jgi:hypothetical protein